MVLVASDVVTMRQLLQSSNMPDDELAGFSDDDLKILLAKRFVTAALLRHASMSDLKEPPGLGTALAGAVLRSFNPGALTSSGRPGAFLETLRVDLLKVVNFAYR